MIVTTTNTIEGHTVREYCGIVFGEVIAGANVFRDIGASFTNFFGGRSAGYEEELQRARNESLSEMCSRACLLYTSKPHAPLRRPSRERAQ